jgi:hypothetical protein
MFGIICLSGHVKSGQRWSGQNRPTDVARDLVLLAHFLLLGQVRFCSPTPGAAFQDVAVM